MEVFTYKCVPSKAASSIKQVAKVGGRAIASARSQLQMMIGHEDLEANQGLLHS